MQHNIPYHVDHNRARSGLDQGTYLVLQNGMFTNVWWGPRPFLPICQWFLRDGLPASLTYPRIQKVSQRHNRKAER
jgi:hypothetical protein